MRIFTLIMFTLLSLGSRADIIDDVLNKTARTDADKKADVVRKPEATLRFFNIKPGDKVLDFFAGGGYYVELLSQVVGKNGRVDAYNNRPYLDWVGRELDARLIDNRLPNVKRIETEVDSLKLPENEYDAIFLVMALHDTYYADPANGWPIIDREQLLAQLRKALKKNGVLSVIDHAAQAESQARDAQTLHRIDEAFLVKELKNAGFILQASSDVLRNPADDHRLSSFEPSMRYHTDRFMLKFKKIK